MTLKEIFDVFFTITEASITARDADGRLLHRWIFGKDIFIGTGMQEDLNKGILTIVDTSINIYGDERKSGWCDAWAVKEKVFPKKLLDAPITFMSACNTKWYSSEAHRIRVDVEMQPLEVEVLVRG